jgi:hypothetical protein
MSDDEAREPEAPPESPQQARAAARLRPAALLLTIVSMLNLTTGVFFLVNAIVAKREGTPAEYRQHWNDDPADRAMSKQFGWTTADDAYLGRANVMLVYGGAAALLSLLTLAGARNMLMLRSYRLAVTGAVLTALPLLTPCCVLGQVAGVWAFVLLMQPDVRSAFE